MTLFQTRTRWGAKVGTDEEFDNGAMCVGDLDNSNHSSVKVATGSLNGLLRVYHPAAPLTVDSTSNDDGKEDDGGDKVLGHKQLEDLLLEQDLGEPILQIEAGRFVSTTNKITLAVLHPRKLTVYSLRGAATQQKKGPVHETNGDEFGSDGEDNEENNQRGNLKAENAGRSAPRSAFYTLEKCYTHRLGEGDGVHFTAFNMVTGAFGGVQGKDFIAVQSVDGKLQVFEQESSAFLRDLNNVMVPGPMCYVESVDSFVVCNSDLKLECYKYHMLAASTRQAPSYATTGQDHLQLDTSLIQTDWVCNVGQRIRAIMVARTSTAVPTTQNDIVALGDDSLFFIRENGMIRAQKRFNIGLRPSCLTSFLRPQGEDAGELHSLLVAHDNGLLQVFQDQALVWAASSQDDQSGASNNTNNHTIPVALQVAHVASMQGSILMLNEQGQLTANYLGTDNAMPTLDQTGGGRAESSTESQSKISSKTLLSFEQVDKEHRQVLRKIRETMASTNGGQEQQQQQQLVVRMHVSEQQQHLSMEDAALMESDGPHGFACDLEGNIIQAVVRVTVSCSGMQDVKDINITTKLPPMIVPSDNAFKIDLLHAGGNGTPYTFEVVLRTMPRGRNVVPSSLKMQLAATYKTADGHVRTCHTELRLPVFLVASVCSTTKGGSFKLTLDANKAKAPRLAALFDDIIRQPSVPHTLASEIVSSSANAISLRYCSDDVVTMLVSKNAARYRVQASSLEALWLITEELTTRLQAYYAVNEAGQAGPKLVFTYNEVLPLADYFDVLDRRFAARLDLARSYSTLNDRAYQLRVVQKRLLTRFKNKNATPIAGLDILFHETYSQVMDCADAVKRDQELVEACGQRLSAATALLTFLMVLSFDMHTDDARALNWYLPSDMGTVNGHEIGWEERVNSALVQALRTGLAKAGKEGHAQGTAPPKPKMAADTKKLKKHITLVCDRLCKGMSLLGVNRKPARVTVIQEGLMKEDGGGVGGEELNVDRPVTENVEHLTEGKQETPV